MRNRPTVSPVSLLSGLSLYPKAFRRMDFLRRAQYANSSLRECQTHQLLLVVLDGLFLMLIGHIWIVSQVLLRCQCCQEAHMSRNYSRHNNQLGFPLIILIICAFWDHMATMLKIEHIGI
jgi:hypothetical protein